MWVNCSLGYAPYPFSADCSTAGWIPCVKGFREAALAPLIQGVQPATLQQAEQDHTPKAGGLLCRNT